MSLKKGGFQQRFPRGKEPLTWTTRDQAALDKLMSASYALTKPELRRLRNLIAKSKQAKGQ